MSLHRYMQMTGNTLVCPVAGHWCPADARGGNTVPSSLLLGDGSKPMSLPSDWRNSWIAVQELATIKRYRWETGFDPEPVFSDWLNIVTSLEPPAWCTYICVPLPVRCANWSCGKPTCPAKHKSLILLLYDARQPCSKRRKNPANASS